MDLLPLDTTVRLYFFSLRVLHCSRLPLFYLHGTQLPLHPLKFQIADVLPLTAMQSRGWGWDLCIYFSLRQGIYAADLFTGHPGARIDRYSAPPAANAQPPRQVSKSVRQFAPRGFPLAKLQPEKRESILFFLSPAGKTSKGSGGF